MNIYLLVYQNIYPIKNEPIDEHLIKLNPEQYTVSYIIYSDKFLSKIKRHINEYKFNNSDAYTCINIYKIKNDYETFTVIPYTNNFNKINNKIFNINIETNFYILIIEEKTPSDDVKSRNLNVHSNLNDAQLAFKRYSKLIYDKNIGMKNHYMSILFYEIKHNDKIIINLLDKYIIDA